jgi:hypothetical protein
VVFCPDCQENLDNVPAGERCPACGGPRRSQSLTAHAAVAQAAAHNPSVQITKDDDRPWIEKWKTIEYHVGKLGDIYTGAERGGNIEAESRANIIFIECDHLADWLQWDKSLNIPEPVIKGYAKSEEPLVVAKAICNSHKHHTRKPLKKGDPPPMTARVWRTTTDGRGGTKVTIKLHWGTPNATYRDALELAEECVAAWLKFFKQHNITVPG